jgi:acyl carrier protein
VIDRIRDILREHARLAVDSTTIGVDEDLYALGMTSIASVSTMLAIEEEFGIEYPDRMLTRTSFASIANIQIAVTELLDQP